MMLWPNMLNKLKNHVHAIQNGRLVAILFFSVDTQSHPHFFTNWSHTVIWVYQYQMQNKFENCHARIQNGCPSANLVTLEMGSTAQKNFFFSNHLFSILLIFFICFFFKFWIKLDQIHTNMMRYAGRPATFFIKKKQENKNFSQEKTGIY